MSQSNQSLAISLSTGTGHRMNCNEFFEITHLDFRTANSGIGTCGFSDHHGLPIQGETGANSGVRQITTTTERLPADRKPLKNSKIWVFGAIGSYF